MITVALGAVYSNSSKNKNCRWEISARFDHDDPKVTLAEKLRTDVCMVMPVKVAPKSDVGFKVIPAGRYAIFLYKGPYDNLQAVYDTIYGKYLPEMECTIRDEASAERYLNNPCDTPPEELLTEIYIPVE